MIRSGVTDRLGADFGMCTGRRWVAGELGTGTVVVV